MLIEEIEESISELESCRATFASCERLAWLYIVRDHLPCESGDVMLKHVHDAEDAENEEVVSFSSVEEEFADAEKYKRLFQETGDASFKQTALDEVRHGENLLNYLKKHGGNSLMLDKYQSRANELRAMITATR